MSKKMKGAAMYDINSFTFFASYYDAIKTMKPQEEQRFLLAILEFMFEGVEPDFKGNMKTNWVLIKPNLIKSKNKSNRNQR
jgi:hypothetical protein